MASQRVKLRLAVSGQSAALTGACTAQNGWTIRGDWQVETLPGQKLCFLTDVSTGDATRLARDANGELVLTESVSAVLTPNGEVADPHCELRWLQEEGIVNVLLGEKVLRFQGLADAVTVECANLEEVSTPPTPDPFNLSRVPANAARRGWDKDRIAAQKAGNKGRGKHKGKGAHTHGHGESSHGHGESSHGHWESSDGQKGQLRWVGALITPITRGGGKFRWVRFFACSVDCSSSLGRKMNHTH